MGYRLRLTCFALPPRRLSLYKTEQGLCGLLGILSLACAGMLCCWHLCWILTFSTAVLGSLFFSPAMVALHGNSSIFVLRCNLGYSPSPLTVPSLHHNLAEPVPIHSNVHSHRLPSSLCCNTGIQSTLVNPTIRYATPLCQN